MHLVQREVWPEQQLVHRLFTVRWTHQCMYTRALGAKDDDETRWQIKSWSRVINEVIPQLGGEFVSIIDTRTIGEIPRGLWMALVQLAADMVRPPTRRALLAADGWAGDNQALATQLVTAGNVRVFREAQLEQMIEYLAGAQLISAERLRAFLS